MTAQLPSTEYTLEDLREIAYRGSYDDMQRNLARALLAAHEQEPVPNYIGSKNALDAIVAFIKSNNNPTLSDYNSVSERLFADNCQSLSSHVIEYITHIGEALEDLRQAASHPAPVPAVPDDTRRMDWLVSKTVNVREPMVYGSHDLFWSQTISDDWDEEHKTTLREQIDAAMLNGGKS